MQRFPKAVIKKQIELISIIGAKIEKRYKELGGASYFGALERDDRNIRYYKEGCLYYSASDRVVYFVHGDIYKRWRQLGGMSWGAPSSDEHRTGDQRGWYSHFKNNSLTIICGPTGTYFVANAIRAKYASMGWESSYLGYPASDEMPFQDGGYVSAFQNGAIYWWQDTGAIDMQQIEVHYVGFKCYVETNDQPWSPKKTADEPYAVFGVIHPLGNSTLRTKVYDDVDSGEARPDDIILYQGMPNGLVIHTTLMENDNGDPNKIKAKVQTAVQRMHEAGTVALGFIPVVGPGVAAVAGPVVQLLVAPTAGFITDFFGLGDDLVGVQPLTLSAKHLIQLSSSATQPDLGVFMPVNVRSQPFTGQGANYVLYFWVKKR